LNTLCNCKSHGDQNSFRAETIIDHRPNSINAKSYFLFNWLNLELSGYAALATMRERAVRWLFKTLI